MVCFESKHFFLASQHSRKKNSRQVVATLFFFLQKQYFLSHKVLTEYFFLPISETDFFLQSNLPTEKNVPKKTIAPRQNLDYRHLYSQRDRIQFTQFKQLRCFYDSTNSSKQSLQQMRDRMTLQQHRAISQLINKKNYTGW